jgi:hypothetical protein
VEKPKIIPKKEENGDDVNGNVEVVGDDDDDEWQVKYKIRAIFSIFKIITFSILGY